MFRPRSFLWFGLVVVLSLSQLAAAPMANGQDASPQSDEPKTLAEALKPLAEQIARTQQALENLQKRMASLEESINKALPTSERPQERLTETEQLERVRRLASQSVELEKVLRDKDMSDRLKELNRRWGFGVVTVHINNAGKPMELVGRIKGMEDFNGDVFLTLATTHPANDEVLIQLSTVAMIEKRP